MIILRSAGRSNHNNISRSGLPFWMLMGMMNSGSNSHSGSWGGFQVEVEVEASAVLVVAALEEVVPEEAGDYTTESLPEI